MVTVHRCPKCNKEFIYKNDYRRHVNRKFSCKLPKKTGVSSEPSRSHQTYPFTVRSHQHIDICSDDKLNTDVINPLDLLTIPPNRKDNEAPNKQMQSGSSHTFKCTGCDKTFTRSDNLERHKAKHCHGKQKQESDEPIDRAELENLKRIISEMQEKLNASQANNVVNGNVNNINNIVTTNQTINNDIKMIAFGKEDLYSLLTDEQAIKYLSRGYQSVCQLIEDLHFDPKKPEHHNVYISDKNRDKALTYNGEMWDTVEKVDVVEQLFDDKACYLNAMYKELKNRLDNKTVTKYSRFMNDTDNEVIESIKRDIRKLLYNKRHIPMATKKAMGK